MFGVLSPAPLWDYIYTDLFGRSDIHITVFGTFVLLFVCFWSWSILLVVPDLTGKPAWMIQYKVQPNTNQPVNRGRLWEAAKVVLFNDIMVGLPYLLLLYPIQLYMGCSCRPGDLPSLITVIRDAVGFIVMEEICFYYTHRLFHWPPLYKMFHKKHHEWTSPVGLVASYCHPVEHVVSNLSPLFLGPTLMGSHLFCLWIWLIFAQTSTVFHHSGYDLPHMPSPLYHDYHHVRFNSNYGGGILDKLHGTDLGVPSDHVKPKRT